MYVKKSDLKRIIREILKEVTQKDILSRHPQTRGSWDANWNPNLKLMTLDNLKSLREKARRMIKGIRIGGNKEGYVEELKREMGLYNLYNNEIERRLRYINKPVSEDHGLGYSHNVSFDMTKKERDPLNDPELNGKLNESQYRFDDFDWLKRGDGFGIPTDVHYGAIFLGTIESEPHGYVLKMVSAPLGNLPLKPSPQNKFNTKYEAAKVLHNMWKRLIKADID